MKKIIMVALVSVYLWADGLSTKPIPSTVDGVKKMAMVEMAYTNKFKDKEALKKKIAQYPSPVEISKMFVKAYLDSDAKTMLKIVPKELIDSLKNVDDKVRDMFTRIEKYDLVQVKEPLGEARVYSHVKNGEKNFTFGFIWVDDRWILVGH